MEVRPYDAQWETLFKNEALLLCKRERISE